MYRLLRLRSAANRLAALPSPVLFLLLFAAVALTHLTLLHLPYYWDEGGYYIPAAFDFYHTGALIPHYTNAHPPLPSIFLGTLWHIVGVHILATRLLVCAFAATGLLAIFRLTQRLLGTQKSNAATAALTVTALTAIYPIWFAQSTLAHADIFSAAFTLWAFALYLPTTQLASGIWHLGTVRPQPPTCRPQPPSTNLKLEAHSSQLTAESPKTPATTHLAIAILFSLAALSKETAIFQPAALALLQLLFLIKARHHPTLRRDHLRWLLTLAFPILPLLAWFAFHHHQTGFTFGNPEYLRYNATANLTAGHVWQALRYRFLHLFWQRNIWLPILLAIACLFLPRRPQTSDPNKISVILSEGDRLRAPQPKDPDAPNPTSTANALQPQNLHSAGTISLTQAPETTPQQVGALAPTTVLTLATLILANWLGFSILGGALLTRYLLPIYPLILLLCVDIWRTRTNWWPALAALTFAAFLSALWLNPPTSFAPEDNLTYRDMILAHQRAIDFVAHNYPNATVLTAWPVAADLFRPELGYVATPIHCTSIDDFTLPNIRHAAASPGAYDTAIVFTTHFLAPAFRHYLLTHPNTPAGRDFAASHDLSPEEIAALLHGTIIFQTNLNGEWSAVLRFPRSYEASAASRF